MSPTAITLFRVAERHGLKHEVLARFIDTDASYISRLASGQYPNIPFRLVQEVWRATRDTELLGLLAADNVRLLSLDLGDLPPPGNLDAAARKARWCMSEVLRLDDPAADVGGAPASRDSERRRLASIITVTNALVSLAHLHDALCRRPPSCEAGCAPSPDKAPKVTDYVHESIDLRA